MPKLLSYFLITLVWSPPAGATTCERLMDSVFTLAELGEVFVRSSNRRDANFVHVTGARQFPLPVVLQSLGLNDVPLAGRRVLSVGEGWSPLLNFVREQGAWALATDCWYGATSYPLTPTGRELSTFVDANRRHLVGARCTRLPFRDQSFDVILSNFLIHHVGFEEGIHFFEEVGRLLSEGGEAIVTQPTYADEDLTTLLDQLAVALDAADFTWSIATAAMVVTNLHTGQPFDIEVLRVKLNRWPSARP